MVLSPSSVLSLLSLRTSLTRRAAFRVERHITWDRTMWGSDQSSSVEIPGLLKLVKGCEAVAEGTMYPPGERILFEAEKVKMESLRPEKK